MFSRPGMLPAAIWAAVFTLSAVSAQAQNTDGKSGATPPGAQSGRTAASEPAAKDLANNDLAKESGAKHIPDRTDDFAAAARWLNGPAGNPECVWIGRRVVALLWEDNVEGSLRHLDLYDRFGCPGPHIQAAFRCIVRQGSNDSRTEHLSARVHSCWLNPSSPPPSTVSAANPAGAGTTTK